MCGVSVNETGNTREHVPNFVVIMTSSEFAAFVGGWLIRQEELRDELVAAREHAGEDGYSDLEDLVARVIRHYKEYFDRKALVRENDCFALFAPTWFSDLETSFLWVAGFKPAMAFSLVDEAVRGMTEVQRERMEMLEMETTVAEAAIQHRLAKVHERVADPAAVEALRRLGREEITAEEAEAVEPITEAVKGVVAAADALRMRTAIKVVGVLGTVQKIQFLAAVASLHMKIRLWGLQRGTPASAAAASMQR